MNRFFIDKETKEIIFIEKSIKTEYFRAVNLNNMWPVSKTSIPLYYDPCPNRLILICIFTWNPKLWKDIFKELK